MQSSGLLAAEAQQKATCFDTSLFVGTSGDTELFEKPSNINGFWASEPQFILYISLFGATVF